MTHYYGTIMLRVDYEGYDIQEAIANALEDPEIIDQDIEDDQEDPLWDETDRICDEMRCA